MKTEDIAQAGEKLQASLSTIRETLWGEMKALNPNFTPLRAIVLEKWRVQLENHLQVVENACEAFKFATKQVNAFAGAVKVLKQPRSVKMPKKEKK